MFNSWKTSWNLKLNGASDSGHKKVDSLLWKRLRFCSLFLIILLQSVVPIKSITVDVIDGKVNETYSLSVVDEAQYAVRYSMDGNSYNFKTEELRVEVDVRDRSFIYEDCPLIITISHAKYASSWDLPREQHISLGLNETTTYFYKLAKTICIDIGVSSENKSVDVALMASTCNKRTINFNAILTSQPTLTIPLDKRLMINVAPNTPRFYRFTFPPNIQTVLIDLDSNDELCMTLSVQKPQCPVFDDEASVRHAGYWQTFTRKAGITVEKKDFPDGFFLVLVVNLKDEGCTKKDGYRPSDNLRSWSIDSETSRAREKYVNITILRALHQYEYTWPTIFPLVVYFPVLILTFILFTSFHRASVSNYSESDEKPKVFQCFLRSEKYICDSYDAVDAMKREKMEHKSKRYLWLLVTVAIFYCIPVFQLIINYLGIVYRTGEQDICYYNNLCSLPLNKVMDFNHIYSNIGYVIFGVAFILFTMMRQRSTQERSTTSNSSWLPLLPKLRRRFDRGTFEQYGLFYSLGFALFMEGFLSASYHICPNKANFQFDTSFMYAMAVLSYVKVYQFRHSLYMSELMAFLLLALVVSSVVFGLFSTNLVYNIMLSLIHLLLVLAFQLYLLYINRIPQRRVDQDSFFEILWGIAKELVGAQRPARYLIQFHPNKGLFWWTTGWNILLVINSWTLVYGSNFATQVLYILLANLALYVVYYFIMKIIHGEFQGLISNGVGNPSLQALIYSGLACLFWLPGLYYFMNELSTWDLSPAMSREKNEPCALLKFYDNHDIWHLLSAPGLFFSFMVIINVSPRLFAWIFLSLNLRKRKERSKQITVETRWCF